jgi:hypothetical protein
MLVCLVVKALRLLRYARNDRSSSNNKAFAIALLDFLNFII